MEQVKSNPLNGATDTKITLSDTRWPSSEGWVKMQNDIYTADGSKITIHFNYNPNGNLFDDFKFVYPK